MNDNNDCPKLATQTKKVLTNIPLGLKAGHADYAVLRVFASWPGDAKLERTLDPEDLDLHPLATLHLANFNQVSLQLGINWFRGAVEQKVMASSKRAHEGRHSDTLREQKQARLGRELSY
jgi:hypothetical protein